VSYDFKSIQTCRRSTIIIGTPSGTALKVEAVEDEVVVEEDIEAGATTEEEAGAAVVEIVAGVTVAVVVGFAAAGAEVEVVVEVVEAVDGVRKPALIASLSSSTCSPMQATL
jgi:hypothetical protein